MSVLAAHGDLVVCAVIIAGILASALLLLPTPRTSALLSCGLFVALAAACADPHGGVVATSIAAIGIASGAMGVGGVVRIP